MLDNDLKKFALLLTSIGEIYGKELNETAINIYWLALKHFEFNEVKKGDPTTWNWQLMDYNPGHTGDNNYEYQGNIRADAVGK